MKKKVWLYLLMYYPFVEIIFLLLARGKAYVSFKMLYFGLIFFFQIIGKDNVRLYKKRNIFFAICMIWFGIYQFCCLEKRIHGDYISFFFIIYIFVNFSYDEIIKEYKELIYHEQNRLIWAGISYFMVLLVSMIGFGGIVNTWGIISVKGPYGINHELAYIAIALSALYAVLYQAGNKKICLVFKWLCFLIVILSGVRTAAIVLVIHVLWDYLKLDFNKKIGYMLLGIAAFLVIATQTDLLTNNPITQKNEAAEESGNLTNGRSTFWKEDMQYYINDTDIREKVLGVGIGSIRKVNSKAFGMNIHAHNDVLNFLIGFGVAYTILFIYAFYIFCRFKNGYLLFLELLVMIMGNGLYMYSIVFCLPMIKMYFMEEKEGEFLG